MQNLPPREVYNFIVSDFHALWDSMASDSSEGARGNFMFALQAMVLLEWASRLCKADPTKVMLQKLTASLGHEEPRYFNLLPGKCRKPSGFDLPHNGAKPQEEQLICFLFDAIRNGQAHQYQQIPLRLLNDTYLGFSLTGPSYGSNLDRVFSNGRPKDHLAYQFQRTQKTLWLRLRPEVLFLDIERAIEASGVLFQGLKYPYFSRYPSTQGSLYQFDASQLKGSLEAQGHLPLT